MTPAVVYRLVRERVDSAKAGVTPDRLALVQEFLVILMVDSLRGLIPHVRLLAQLTSRKFVPPLSRRMAKLGAKPLPEDPASPHRTLTVEQVVAVGERKWAAFEDRELFPEGPEAALASLLVNPLALWDLADWIGYEMPDAWMPDFEETRVEPKPAPRATNSEPARGWVGAVDPSKPVQIAFDGLHGIELARRIAISAYGDEEYPFTLSVRTRTGPDAVHLHLQLRPPPTRVLENVSIPALFADGERRDFLLAAYEKIAVERAGRTSVCDPLPAKTVPFKNAVVEVHGGVEVIRCYSVAEST